MTHVYELLPFITFLSLFALSYFLTPANKPTFKSLSFILPYPLLNLRRKTGKREMPQAEEEGWIHPMQVSGYLGNLKIVVIAHFKDLTKDIGGQTPP